VRALPGLEQARGLPEQLRTEQWFRGVWLREKELALPVEPAPEARVSDASQPEAVAERSLLEMGPAIQPTVPVPLQDSRLLLAT